MSARMVAQIRVDNPEEYQEYLGGFLPIFEKHGGELLATSRNQTVVIEGDWAHPHTVIMRFPSVEAARRWYNDPAYMALAAHRHRSAETNLVLVEGIA